jgi:tetratricopeptide (TPR) repeat protein
LTTLIAKTTDEKKLNKYNTLWEILKRIETEKDKANECFKKGDYDGAIDLYTRLLEVDTNNNVFNATILCNRALCYQKKNKLIEALRDINQSINNNDNYWKAYYRRATINIALKNVPKAKDDLNKVIQLDQSNIIYF